MVTALFNWNRHFLTGLTRIDDEHQQVVELINDLGEQMMAPESTNSFNAFVSTRTRLLDYVHHHFSYEEQLMEEYGVDPRFFQKHVLEHKQFAHEIKLLGEFYSPEGCIPELGNLLDYLVNWLAYHILGMDHSMIRQIEAITGGSAPAAAFVLEEDRHEGGTEPLLQALRGLFMVISERNRELRELNLTLEDRVRQRTDELEKANQRLRYLADYDDLTGLPNRRYALNALKQMWLEARGESAPLSILLLDADKFKYINDTFGHAEGDGALRQLAHRLKEAVRTSDVVCRLGGDEFVVLCPETDASGAQQVADKIRDSRKSHYTKNGDWCWNGEMSIGIATAGDKLEDINDLLIRADKALYLAKGLRTGQDSATHRVL